MKREKAIEIPFGAKDSEWIKWEYTIPEGMEAEIKDGKVIIKKAESEDERIRRTLVEYFGPQAQLDFIRGVPIKKIRYWLEKQKEQKPAEWSEELKNELAKKHLEGYIMGREDTMREMKDFLESHFNTQSGTSTLKAEG